MCVCVCVCVRGGRQNNKFHGAQTPVRLSPSPETPQSPWVGLRLWPWVTSRAKFATPRDLLRRSDSRKRDRQGLGKEGREAFKKIALQSTLNIEEPFFLLWSLDGFDATQDEEELLLNFDIQLAGTHKEIWVKWTPNCTLPRGKLSEMGPTMIIATRSGSFSEEHTFHRL